MLARLGRLFGGSVNPLKAGHEHACSLKEAMGGAGSMTELHIRWAENSWPALEAALARDPLVVLPIGALEQHGPHLPVGVDANSVEEVALRTAEALRGSEPPTLVLPTLWYGYSPHHMTFKGTVTLRSETFLAVAADIAELILSHGGRRIVLLNGHGGNVGSLDVVASRLGQVLARTGPHRRGHLFSPCGIAGGRVPPIGGRRHGSCL